MANHVLLKSSVDNSSIFKGVLGGANANLREFPFQVSLHYDNTYYCGGSILGTVFILTAAHCVFNLNSSKFKVTAGDHNRMKNEGTEQERGVSHIFVHGDYDRTSLENDIALMVLSEPLNLNTHVQRIKFLRDEVTHAGMATVSGWGQLLHGGQSHPLLQKVDVPIIPSTECKKAFKESRIDVKMDEDVLCAGGSGKDACKGDSGGPLSARKEENDERILVGLVSWGAQCTRDSNLPGVYINVSKYSKWIETTMMKFGRESGRCKDSQFYCSTDNICIYSHWVCDGDKDCSHGEDEIPTLCDLPCRPGEFQCPGGKCIDIKWTCEGRPDCKNAEDEQNCTSCRAGSRKCTQENKCYSLTSKCDGTYNCENAEDESNCDACHGRGLYCKKDRKCIPWSLKCNSERDCSDGADESKCFCIFGICFNYLF